jgi:hypothetical protein
MTWQDYGVERRKRGGLLIGLNGVARSGKDTVGEMLCKNHGFTRLSFADAVKDGLYALNPIIVTEDILIRDEEDRIYTRFDKGERIQYIVDTIGWDKAKTDILEVRELLQRYGTEAGREIHGVTCWTDIVKKTIEANPTTHYVITDARFANEVSLVKAWGGTAVQIQRNGVTSVNGHASDAVLDPWMFDHILKNNGTLSQLEQAVNDLVIEINPHSLLTKTA